jgi:hypothetical protein
VGDANDYVAKGLCGGRVIVRPPACATYSAEESMIVGNVACYGATSGEAFFRGVAAERFCVRNSGAVAVVEGVGDHCCEYMTGGTALILGKTGRNFGCGMSGGIAYVYDPEGVFPHYFNPESASLEPVGEEPLILPNEVAELKALITKHQALTGSEPATRILADWETQLRKIVKVMPNEYKAVLIKNATAAKTAADPAAAPSPAPAPEAPASACGAVDKLDIEDMGVAAKERLGTATGSATPGLKGSGNSTSVQIEFEPPRRPTVVDVPVKHRGFIAYERAVVGYRPAAVRMEVLPPRPPASRVLMTPAAPAAPPPPPPRRPPSPARVPLILAGRRRRPAGLARDRDASGRAPAQDTDRALHGLRRALLPPGHDRLPARQQDPRVERAGAPRPVARGARPAALHQQLPGVHRVRERNRERASERAREGSHHPA